MAAKLRYLTVQDILWINLQITRSVNRYSYAILEEATYYQYAYGDSDDITVQAARFLVGFCAKSPLSSGNEATAFVALLTVLEINGYHVNLSAAEAPSWFQGAKVSASAAAAAVQEIASASDEHDSADLHATVASLLSRYEQAIESIGGSPVEFSPAGSV